ncbi:MAG: hypothetical protein A3D50_01485 [Candidatus Taylorbacteria bacterium RIFCSPHIGHO2_02_FULL_44_12]|uniref:Uncharacterized protein n=1 Tax=Candidatus Taylorbacteria bacterium RIFCSPHIGHO2_02_FULL_44_12 TaxID=1802308 RepID=A0A1G2MN72_9BACT|nr:MAG: hypothetical protein A3D50_01485 [Candidatus Taylorbacteria bacterium RIFCSPHIGHO2_02_FULL_44_12]
MKFVLVAGDYAQSEVMEMLGNKLQEKGHAIALFLRRGKKEPLPIEDIRKEIQSSDWLVSGMSNVSDDEVAAVRSAHEYGKLVALYADTFANYRFPAFEPIRGFVKKLFTINQSEADDAASVFPKNTEIVLTGNPRWEEFAFPVFSREEVREQLSVPEDWTIVLCPGDKYLVLLTFTQLPSNMV